ncbi:hypothetical protein BC829DRAFT_397390 [Chytridium lagenaria]|nr:hypothetical protein BC829DRAFT_397390 [Chytridium lagenaria]
MVLYIGLFFFFGKVDGTLYWPFFFFFGKCVVVRVRDLWQQKNFKYVVAGEMGGKAVLVFCVAFFVELKETRFLDKEME